MGYLNVVDTPQVLFSALRSALPRDLHSFPTRRSSDLHVPARAEDAIRQAQRRVRLERAVEVHRSEEHTSELQSLTNLVCRLLLEKKMQSKRQDLIQSLDISIYVLTIS